MWARDPLEQNTLYWVYDLALKICMSLKEYDSFLEMTDNVLDDQYIRLWLKSNVVHWRLVCLDKLNDKARLKSESEWLIRDLPERTDEEKAWGYGGLIKVGGVDAERMFYYLAQYQTGRDCNVNYIYHSMAENRYKAGKYKQAMGLYLLAWNLTSSAGDPVRARKIEKSLEECLVTLGCEDKANEWAKWLKTPVKERIACPVLGMGTIPEEWAKKWQTVPDRFNGQDTRSVLKKAEALYGTGRMRPARPMFERIFRGTREIRQREQKSAGNYLQLYEEKWGKQVPNAFP